MKLMVRLHPAYITRGSEDQIQKEMDRFRCLQNNGDIILSIPEMKKMSVGWEMPLGDVDHIGGILSNTSVLVNQYSTLMLEASIFDVPIVNIGYGSIRN